MFTIKKIRSSVFSPSLNKINLFAFQKRLFGYTTLYSNTNQAQGLAEYAIDFLE